MGTKADNININKHPADSRGLVQHSWLRSYHTYSFASYYREDRMGFGVLRVINDDYVKPSKGFGEHSHQNMEIISIPLSGTLRHQDNIGHQQVIHADEVQLMSAGSGITHSEYNHSDTEEVNFLQIWILPKEIDTTPHYQQLSFDPFARKNKFQLLVSPDGREHSLSVNQNAYFSRIDLDKGKTINYSLFCHGNGVYLFVISGQVVANETTLNERDGIEISQSELITLTAKTNIQLLCIEVLIAL